MLEKVSSCREALEVSGGVSLLVKVDELQALPEVKSKELPPGFTMRKVRGDCYLVGWRRGDDVWALKLDRAKLKPDLVEFLTRVKPV